MGAVSSYTFSNITANRTIAATFVAQTTTYTISASAGTGGVISPSGSVSVASGSSKTFTITPNSGYRISTVTVNGSSVGAVSSYTFSNITANRTIAATFTPLIPPMLGVYQSGTGQGHNNQSRNMRGGSYPYRSANASSNLRLVSPGQERTLHCPNQIQTMNATVKVLPGRVPYLLQYYSEPTH